MFKLFKVFKAFKVFKGNSIVAPQLEVAICDLIYNDPIIRDVIDRKTLSFSL